MEINQILAQKAVRKHFSSAGWALLTALLIPLSLSYRIQGILQIQILRGNYPAILNNALFRWAISYLPVYGIGIPLAMWMLSKLPADIGEKKKMPVSKFLEAFIMCYPFMLGGNLLGNWLAQILTGGRSTNNVVEILSQQDLMTTLTIVVLAPVMEELIFRKFLIDHTARFGEKNAVIFSALAFGLFHCNVYQIFYAFGIGLVFGYVYVRTRNIKYTMLMHFIINFLSGVVSTAILNSIDPALMKLLTAENTEILMDMLQEDPQLLLSLYTSVIPLILQNLLIIGLAIAGCILLCTRKKYLYFLPKPQELSTGTEKRAVYLNAGVICFFVLFLFETVLVLIATCMGS